MGVEENTYRAMGVLKLLKIYDPSGGNVPDLEGSTPFLFYDPPKKLHVFKTSPGFFDLSFLFLDLEI